MPSCSRVFIFLVLFLTPGFLPGTGRAGEPSPDSAAHVAAQTAAPAKGVYEQAIREAENALKRQNETPGGEAGGWGLSEALAVAALLAAVGLTIVMMRHMRGAPFLKGSAREMRLLDRLAIGRQSSLLIVRVRGRDYWLAENPGGMTLLKELPEEPPPAVPQQGDHGK